MSRTHPPRRLTRRRRRTSNKAATGKAAVPAARMTRWPGNVGVRPVFPLSRAVRVGGVCVVRPPAAGGADRRSAFQAVPALRGGWRYVVSAVAGCEGGWGLRRPPACGGLCRPEVGVPSRSRASGWLAVRGFAVACCEGGWGLRHPPACGGLCRPEVGVPSRLRASGWLAVRGFAVACCEGGWGLRHPPACGGLCRPEVGVPSRPRAFFLLRWGVPL